MTQIIYDESGKTSGAGISRSTNKNLLVIVDAISTFIDDDSEDMVPHLQKLIDSGAFESVHEFFTWDSKLRHSGARTKGQEGKLEQIPSQDLVIAGGSLGNEHLRVFNSILEQMRKQRSHPTLHMPLEYCYSFEDHYDSGESWTTLCRGRKDMEILGAYTKALEQHASGSYIVSVDREVVSHSHPTVLHIWSNWYDLAEYLQEKK